VSFRIEIARTTGNLIFRTAAGDTEAVVEPRTRRILFLRDNRNAALVKAMAAGYR
jgi:hypothetical protein